MKTCAPWKAALLLLGPSLLLAPLCYAKVYKSYNGTSAHVDSNSWDVLNAGCCRDISLKPSLADLLASNSFPPAVADGVSPPSPPGSKPLRIALDAATPADQDGMQKVHYLVVSGNNFDAPQATSVRYNTGYAGFAFMFDAAYQTATPTRPVDETNNEGTQLWQGWQGSGWPPIQIRTNETDGSIRLYVKISSDDCRGSFKPGCTAIKYLTDNTGVPIAFQRAQWYRIVVATRADPSGGGYAAVWLDNDANPSAEYHGKLGYTPASEGGQADTIDGLSISFGLYRPRPHPPVGQVVYFDRVKYAQTKEETLPFYTPEEIASVPQLIKSGEGYCRNGYKELKDDRGRGLRVESPWHCLKVSEEDAGCIASPSGVSFGKGSRKGRCRCDSVLDCGGTKDGGLGEDGFDRFSVML